MSIDSTSGNKLPPAPHQVSTAKVKEAPPAESQKATATSVMDAYSSFMPSANRNDFQWTPEDMARVRHTSRLSARRAALGINGRYFELQKEMTLADDTVPAHMITTWTEDVGNAEFLQMENELATDIENITLQYPMNPEMRDSLIKQAVEAKKRQFEQKVGNQLEAKIRKHQDKEEKRLNDKESIANASQNEDAIQDISKNIQEQRENLKTTDANGSLLDYSENYERVHARASHAKYKGARYS